MPGHLISILLRRGKRRKRQVNDLANDFHGEMKVKRARKGGDGVETEESQEKDEKESEDRVEERGWLNSLICASRSNT